MRIIYVSGRYRSKTIFGVAINIWKARRVAKKLWADGWVVICPHLNTAFMGGDATYIRGDREIVKRCDAIYMLKGWQKSEGASIEYRVAIENKLEVIFENEG